MNETYERIKAKLQFDPLDFDQQLIELPMLVLDAAEMATLYAGERDKAKGALDLAMAQAADQLRTNTIIDAKGNPKIRAEAQIESELPLYENVQEAQQKFDECKYRLALSQNLVDALKVKRDAMKVYAELTISGYLSPNAALNDRRSEIRAASNSTMRRRPISQGE